MSREDFVGRSLRVLMLATDNHPSSGAFLSMTALCRLLKSEHNAQVLVVLPRPGDGEKLLEKAGVDFVHIRSFGWVKEVGAHGAREFIDRSVKRALNLTAIWRLKRLIASWKPDILHTNTIYGYVGIAAAKACGKPHIWHIREFLEEGQGKTLWDRDKGERIIAGSTRVVAVSSQLAGRCLRYVPKDRLAVVLNGIDETRYARRQEPILSKKVSVLLYGGGYDALKGFDCLLNALKLVKDRNREFRLLLLGSIPECVSRSIEASELTDCIEALGYREDVAEVLKDVDITFCTSSYEAFGRKTAEGMMAGALVIASDTGGTLDLIRNGETGLLYRQNDARDLAEKLCFALDNPQEARRIALNGNEYAMTNLTARRNASEIFEVYKTVLTGRTVKNA